MPRRAVSLCERFERFESMSSFGFRGMLVEVDFLLSVIALGTMGRQGEKKTELFETG